jgi:DNA (cytosine-5)-methyltransferase 1
MKKRVVELFAGVGGFRVGFNSIRNFDEQGKAIEKTNWDFVWANQWEPGTKVQHAFNIYTNRFGKSENHVNEDIFKINKDLIPNHDVLVGGFPCQDYSVARSLSGEKGIEGKKGVLWWEIYKTIQAKKPAFVLLENVDRLIKSPSKKRGRDFGIMLACFQEQNYSVEWRVINAADYGFPQRRKRVFIFASKKDVLKLKINYEEKFSDIATSKGFFARAFSVDNEINNYSFKDLIFSDLLEVSNTFTFDFKNYGYLSNNVIQTCDVSPIYNGKRVFLKDIIDKNSDKKEFLIHNVEKWKYLKSAKKLTRTSKSGFTYTFSEGQIAFPDNLDRPARTMLTSESSLNRSSHLLYDSDLLSYRTLTPIEAERLNGFPDNWTDFLSNKQRFFMMGNALVCGVVEKLADELEKIM